MNVLNLLFRCVHRREIIVNMSKKHKRKLREPESLKMTVVRAVGFSTAFLPCTLYFICTVVIFPASSNPFFLVGFFAALLLGIPCMLLVGSAEKEAFGIETSDALQIFPLLCLPFVMILLCVCLFLYLPALQNADVQEKVSALLLNTGILLFELLLYILFRQSAKACLRTKGFSKTSIRKMLKERPYKILFEPFRKELGLLYVLNFVMLILFATEILLLLPAVFWQIAAAILVSLHAISMFTLAVTLFVSGYYSNFELLSYSKKHNGLISYLVLAAFLCYLAVKLL